MGRGLILDRSARSPIPSFVSEKLIVWRLKKLRYFLFATPRFPKDVGISVGHQGSPSSFIGNSSIKFEMNMGYQWNETDSEELQ